MDFEEARERERRGRTQTIRMGLMICSVLLLLDYVNSPTSSRARPGGRRPTGGSAASTQAYRYLSSNETSRINNLVTTTGKIGNLSSVYRGTWNTICADQNTDAKRNIERGVISGDATLQLRMLPLEGAPDVVFVYGVVKLDGTSSIHCGRGKGYLKDSYYPFQGVYLLRDNILAVAITPTRRVKVFLSAPMNSDRTPGSENNISTGYRLLSTDLIGVDQIFSSIDVDITQEIKFSTTDVLGSLLDFLGYGVKKLNNLRRIIDFASSPLMRSERIKGSIASSKVSDRMQFSGVGNEIPSSRDRGTFRRPARALLRQSMLSNSTLFMNSLVPQLTLSESTKESMALLSSVPVGDTGLQLVTARLAAQATTGSATAEAVGLGDDMIPASFKSMQTQLGSTLDSVCPSSTSLRMSRLGVLVKGSNSNGGLLVKKMSGVVESAACGTQLNTTLSEYHIDVERLGSKVGTYSTFLMVVCSAQIYLLVLQMKHAEPQGSSARMSMLTVGSQALLDAVLCVGHLLLSVAIPSVFFYYFMWIAILKLVIYSVLEMRMMIGIYRARNLQNAALNNALALRRYLSVIHTRFFIALFGAMMIVNVFYDRPILLIFVFYSFWVPQIVYNAYEGTRQPYLPQFAVGMTISRLFIPLYAFGCPENFLTELLGNNIVSMRTCATLLSWLAIQIAVLEMQAKFGSRFFVPKRFLPIAYDYHRPINSTELSPLQGRGLSSDGTTSGAGDIESGDMKECVICYNVIDAEENEYMITPCDHLFHGECLSRWMEVKLECPVCRSQLPPLMTD